jgi:hypothetical protein
MSSGLPSINRVAKILGGDVMEVHEPHARRWVGLPDKTQIDRGVQVRRDDRGKAVCTPVLRFVLRDVVDAFSESPIKALSETYPLVLELAS